jgi:hypothetical protein
MVEDSIMTHANGTFILQLSPGVSRKSESKHVVGCLLRAQKFDLQKLKT